MESVYVAVDEGLFFSTRPVFELFFAEDGVLFGGKGLRIDKSNGASRLCMDCSVTRVVPCHSESKIVCMPDIKTAVRALEYIGVPCHDKIGGLPRRP